MIPKLLTIAVVFGLAAQATTITATASQSSYVVGDSLAIDVSASNFTDLYAFQFDLVFDSTVLAAQSVTEEGFFLSNGVSFSPGTIDNTTGTISFIADTLSGSGPGFTGNSQLASITFNALAAGVTTVSPVNVTLLNSGLSDITVSSVGASIDVSEPSSVPEPGSPATIILGLGLIACRKLGKRRSRNS